MGRSFSAECAALGLRQLDLESNSALGELLSGAIKDFATQLRFQGERSQPHHWYLKGISNAAGFPTWDAFNRACRRLAMSSKLNDDERSAFCDVLPLLIRRPDFRSHPRAAQAFESFAKRVEGHLGYTRGFVDDELARFWGEQSYAAMKERTAPECATFLFEVNGEAIWPAVVGPLREILADVEYKAAVTAEVRKATLRDAHLHVAALEATLRKKRIAFPEPQRLAYHAKTLRELPGQVTANLRKHDALGIAYAYWKFCRDVAGASGTRTWQQYQQRTHSLFGEAQIALKAFPLTTEIPCPVCGEPAPVEVVLLPAEERWSCYEHWSLRCACGHREGRSFLGGYLEDESDNPLVNCKCSGCRARRGSVSKQLTEFSQGIRERLSEQLTQLANSCLPDSSGNSALTLTADGTALAGQHEAFRYEEIPVHRPKFKGSVIGNSLSEVRAEAIARELKARGAAVRRLPTSLRLAQKHGFHRRVYSVALPDMVSFFFTSELAARWPIDWIATSEEGKKRLSKEASGRLEAFLAGFSATSPDSFQDWLKISGEYVHGGSRAIPLFVSVASSEEALQLEIERWQKLQPQLTSMS